MLKKALSALIVLALLAVTTLAEPADPPDIFIPQKLVPAINSFMADLAAAMTELSGEEQAEFARSLALGPADSQGLLTFYSNTDGSLELTAYCEGRAMDPAQPADTIGFVLHDALGEHGIHLVRAAVAKSIAQLDGRVDPEALGSWLANAQHTGDRFDMDGCCLVLLRADGYWSYSLLSGKRTIDAQPTPAPAQELSDPAGQNLQIGDMLIEWNGFSAQLLRVVPEQFSAEDTFLSLYCRIINDSERRLWLKAENATVNGISVDSFGAADIDAGTDSGGYSDKGLFLKPHDSADTAAIRALLAPETVVLTLEVMDGETRETLVTRTVTLPLGELLAPTPMPLEGWFWP